MALRAGTNYSCETIEVNSPRSTVNSSLKDLVLTVVCGLKTVDFEFYELLKTMKIIQTLKTLIVILIMVSALDSFAQTAPAKSSMVLEIRCYNLKPGTRDEFHKLVEQTVALLKQYKIEVVGYGPSLHDDTSYYLMRSFSSQEERNTLEDAFYGSDDWKNGNREAVLARIENYTTVVIPSSKLMIEAYIRAINGN